MIRPSASESEFLIEQAKSFLLQAPEVCIFNACRGMIEELRGLERAVNSGQISQSAFSEKFSATLLQLAGTAAVTERFGIVSPVVDYGQFSPLFWRWFNWWDDYFKLLNPEKIREIEQLGRERLPAVNVYRPVGHWASYRHAPAFTLAITESGPHLHGLCG